MRHFCHQIFFLVMFMVLLLGCAGVSTPPSSAGSSPGGAAGSSPGNPNPSGGGNTGGGNGSNSGGSSPAFAYVTLNNSDGIAGIRVNPSNSAEMVNGSPFNAASRLPSAIVQNGQ